MHFSSSSKKLALEQHKVIRTQLFHFIFSMLSIMSSLPTNVVDEFLKFLILNATMLTIRIKIKFEI